jgi:hypothetical protein
MQNRFVVAVLAIATVLLLPLAAEGIIVGTNPDVHFDFQGMCANDFHVEGLIHSLAGNPPTVQDIFVFGDSTTGNWMVTGYTLVQPDPINRPDDWWFTADFATDGMICYCQWIHFGIMFDVTCYNVIVDLHGWWTLDGQRIFPPKKDLTTEVYDSDVAVTGFHVDDVGRIRPGQQTLRIQNNTDVEIGVPVLELAVGRELVPLPEMNEEHLGRAGTGPSPDPRYAALEWIAAPVASAPLGAGDHFDVALEAMGIHLGPGDFLHIRGKQEGDASVPPGMAMKTKSGQEPWGFFWEQHEAHY